MNDKIERTRAQWLGQSQRWLPMLDSIKGDTVEEVVTLPADDYDAMRAERDAAVRERDRYKRLYDGMETEIRASIVGWGAPVNPDNPPEQNVHQLSDMLNDAARLLRETREALADWGDYIDNYYKDKHGFYDDMEKMNKFLARYDLARIDKENGDERRD